MIIVTGATGQLGRDIVERLVELVPAAEVGVSVREPSQAGDLEALGVRVRRGDFSDPDSLPSAFEGVDQILLVSSNARAYGGDPLAQHRTAIAAARAAGAKRIVYTSQVAANPKSKFPPARDHAATESMLADSGLKWTALRHGFYGASAMMTLGDGLNSGSFDAPKDGPVAWTARADLALADAAILADEGRFDGPTPPLTAAETHDFDDLAQIASEVLGRPVRRNLISDDQLRAGIAARGWPASAADHALGTFLAAREGEFSAVDPTLEQLIGRRPTGMREQIQAASTLAGATR